MHRSMTRIFDNVEQDLLTPLRGTMQVSKRADFCVGYLNLRGWQAVDDLVQPWNPEEGQVCRVLVANAFQLSPVEADYIAGYTVLSIELDRVTTMIDRSADRITKLLATPGSRTLEFK
jgi:hypothetical protein